MASVTAARARGYEPRGDESTQPLLGRESSPATRFESIAAEGYTAAAMTTQRVGVIAGGESPEREVSLASGACVHRALCQTGRPVTLLALDSLDDLVGALAGIDVVFNCLHGGAGENGTLQLLLDLLGVDYAGSGAQAAFRAMDKVRARALFEQDGLHVPPGLAWTGKDLRGFRDRVLAELGVPVVVKPIDAGSSIGVHVVDRPEDLEGALVEVTTTLGSALVERHIEGRELTVGVLRIDGQERSLPVVEIHPRHGFFDYRAKYEPGAAEFLVPAPLGESVTSAVQEAGLRAHRALGCRGYSRVDLRLASDGTPFVLEVNASPGMTENSDLPRAAAAAGYSFSQLVSMMLDTIS